MQMFLRLDRQVILHFTSYPSAQLRNCITHNVLWDSVCVLVCLFCSFLGGEPVLTGSHQLKSIPSRSTFSALLHFCLDETWEGESLKIGRQQQQHISHVQIIPLAFSYKAQKAQFPRCSCFVCLFVCFQIPKWLPIPHPAAHAHLEWVAASAEFLAAFTQSALYAQFK